VPFATVSVAGENAKPLIVTVAVFGAAALVAGAAEVPDPAVDAHATKVRPASSVGIPSRSARRIMSS